MSEWWDTSLRPCVNKVAFVSFPLLCSQHDIYLKPLDVKTKMVQTILSQPGFSELIMRCTVTFTLQKDAALQTELVGGSNDITANVDLFSPTSCKCMSLNYHFNTT